MLLFLQWVAGILLFAIAGATIQALFFPPLTPEELEKQKNCKHSFHHINLFMDDPEWRCPKCKYRTQNRDEVFLDEV